MKFGVALVLALATSVLSAADPKKAPLPIAWPDDLSISLPKSGKVGLQWVLPMLTTKDGSAVEGQTFEGVFDVDAKGLPWFGTKGRLISSPLGNLSFASDVAFQNFVFLSNGDLLACTQESIGTYTTNSEIFKKTRSAFPFLAFKAAYTIDQFDPELYAGDENTLFLHGKNEDKTYSILSFVPGKKGRDPVKVTDCRARADAVTGDKKRVYFSQGREVWEVMAPSGQPKKIFTHPKQAILGLSFSKSAGLYYATATEVGLIEGPNALPFIKTPDPEIRVRGDELFVLLGRHLAVLKLSGISEFSRLAKKTDAAVAAK